MMESSNQRVDIAPAFSFKPIDDDGADGPSGSSSSRDHQRGLVQGGTPSPLSDGIFKEDCNMSVQIAAQSIQQGDQPMQGVTGGEDEGRMISPYPFPNAASQDVVVTEREQFTLDWPALVPSSNNKVASTCPIILPDFSSCVLDGGVGTTEDVAMNDDFSVSVQEVESLSREDLDLEDPASFWEKGASNIPNSIFIERTKSPTEVSLSSSSSSSESTGSFSNCSVHL